MTASLLMEIANGVAHLTINRPERLNAMDSHAHLALSEALDHCAIDKAVHVLVLTGAGDRAFSVGRDLRELSQGEDPEIAARWHSIRRLTDRHDYPKPIIAKVAGYALGGGFELALACDIIIAAENAIFGLPEARRGLIPFAGGVHRLPRQIPLKIAMGHLLTGRELNAARAYELGLVNEVVPVEHLDKAVASWTSDILACAPLSIRAIKECVSDGLRLALPEAMAATYPAEEMRQASRDSIEGPRAFAEKRAPVWTGA
ncbi:enoyl-CoA hydratase-related protein [Novosphingobium sp.]|uniref:enoyl-CoA hydratase-related protein n=1 Tax=Novosphingobium sp. TaxID=1874826 RepID=UPI002B47FB54|nr:enoyl-CoA hydratase-related protein [Novosphingobium sp.]HKR91755.1 enoyl-CoA hydratase-related protein [Novosphingobium sp.]